MNSLILQGLIKLIESSSKGICNFTKDFRFKSITVCSFDIFSHQGILKNGSGFPQKNCF